MNSRSRLNIRRKPASLASQETPFIYKVDGSLLDLNLFASIAADPPPSLLIRTFAPPTGLASKVYDACTRGQNGRSFLLGSAKPTLFRENTVGSFQNAQGFTMRVVGHRTDSLEGDEATPTRGFRCEKIEREPNRLIERGGSALELLDELKLLVTGCFVHNY